MERTTRKPNRLRNYDYSAPGAYFLTVCTHEKRCLLSRIPVGEELAPPAVRLTAIGGIVEKQVRQLPGRFPGLTVEHFVIMPNHIHLLLHLKQGPGGASSSPTVDIRHVLQAFKSITTVECHKSGICSGPLWQRSYHDHIIRDEADHRRIAEYIETNPARWTEDCFYIFEP